MIMECNAMLHPTTHLTNGLTFRELVYEDYCSRICVCEYSVYTNVNVNVSISGIALNQRSVQQASKDIRASSANVQEKASLSSK